MLPTAKWILLSRRDNFFDGIFQLTLNFIRKSNCFIWKICEQCLNAAKLYDHLKWFCVKLNDIVYSYSFQRNYFEMNTGQDDFCETPLLWNGSKEELFTSIKIHCSFQIDEWAEFFWRFSNISCMMLFIVFSAWLFQLNAKV